MSPVPPVPILVRIDDTWIPGKLRTCEVTPDGFTCTNVVSYGPVDCVTTGRFPASAMRMPNGQPGCPVANRRNEATG